MKNMNVQKIMKETKQKSQRESEVRQHRARREKRGREVSHTTHGGKRYTEAKRRNNIRHITYTKSRPTSSRDIPKEEEKKR